MEIFKENILNLKKLLFVAACSSLFVSQLTLAFSGSESATSVKQKEEWKTSFTYNDTECKKHGYGAGMIKIGSEKYCAKRPEVQTTNLKKTSNSTWNKTTSTTDWLFCNGNSSSCSQSLSTGSNSCVSASTSVTKSISVTAGFEAEIVKDVLSFGASTTATKSWSKTKGTSICASKNLSQTCTVGPKRKVRLKHNFVMQHFKGDVTVKGWKMRQKRTTYKNTFSGTLTYKFGDWHGYKSKSHKSKGAVEANLPIRRTAVCDAQKL